MWWQSILVTGCVVVSLAFVLLESLQSEGHDRETKRKRKEFHKVKLRLTCLVDLIT